MKRFNAEQAQISYDLKDNCVGLFTSTLLGGGDLKLAPQGFRGLEKTIKKMSY